MNSRKNRFFDRITEHAAKLTPTEKQIADHLMRTYPNCLLKNASELAREVEVNVSTMTRFFQKIGYKNIREAQCEFRDDVSFQLSSPIEQMSLEENLDSDDKMLQKSMETDMVNIQKFYKELSVEALYALTDLLSDIQQEVYIASDSGRAQGLAHYLFSQLRAVRPSVTHLKGNPLDLANDMTELNSKSVLIIFDLRPYAKLNQQIVRIFGKCGGTVVAITDSPLSPIGEGADLVFTIPTQSPSPFESYLTGFAFMDLVINILSKDCMGYIKANYKKTQKRYIDLDIFF
ncbi:MAG: MurR/RpiR family transcriptional regulator [Desulfobacterales bacterium]|nr:MurR/RpiR family transcriptional regulator [Desulfobacterales bacterium]